MSCTKPTRCSSLLCHNRPPGGNPNQHPELWMSCGVRRRRARALAASVKQPFAFWQKTFNFSNSPRGVPRRPSRCGRASSWHTCLAMAGRPGAERRLVRARFGQSSADFGQHRPCSRKVWTDRVCFPKLGSVRRQARRGSACFLCLESGGVLCPPRVAKASLQSHTLTRLRKSLGCRLKGGETRTRVKICRANIYLDPSLSPNCSVGLVVRGA